MQAFACLCRSARGVPPPWLGPTLHQLLALLLDRSSDVRSAAAPILGSLGARLAAFPPQAAVGQTPRVSPTLLFDWATAVLQQGQQPAGYTPATGPLQLHQQVGACVWLNCQCIASNPPMCARTHIKASFFTRQSSFDPPSLQATILSAVTEAVNHLPPYAPNASTIIDRTLSACTTLLEAPTTGT